MIESNVSIEERLRGYYARTEAPIDELEKARVVAIVSNEVAPPRSAKGKNQCRSGALSRVNCAS